MSSFARHLKDTILHHGPMDVGTFMGMAAGHYYATRDPFGVKGDFTTAPEISQMFGEMLGVFLADAWMKAGSPETFSLVEAGPGRGTLMADILRATKAVTGFHGAMRVHLVEMSPVLKARQQEMLKGFQATWHETLDGVPQDVPVFMVANEFFDALPIRQYVWKDESWFERVVGVEGERFVFGMVACPPSQLSPPQMGGMAKGGGDVWEHSPAREAFVKDLSMLIKHCSGVALLIDYGHDRSGLGDTLQAVKDHQFIDVLEQVGDADLTSHVDFEILKAVASEHVVVHGPVGQGDFLNALGISLRAGRLNQPDEYARLTAPDQMGTLFRVMVLCDDADIVLAGF